MNENQNELPGVYVKEDRVVHIPLRLFRELVECAGHWSDDPEVDIKHLFDVLDEAWVLIYQTSDPGATAPLQIVGFPVKEELSLFLEKNYGREVAVDSIIMILEDGRQRRFQLEVRPKIGF
jgi:hypothetical protein